jgi:hypothetical protein
MAVLSFRLIDSGFKIRYFSRIGYGLRHNNIMTACQMRTRHPCGERAPGLKRIPEHILPAADQGYYLIDVEIQDTRMPVREHLSYRRLADAWRSV